MARGKPLYLNEERYAALTYMVSRCFDSPISKSIGRTKVCMDGNISVLL